MPIDDIATRTHFGAALRKIRRRQRARNPAGAPSNMTIFKTLEVSKSTVSHYFNGKSLPVRSELLQQLLELLEASEDEIAAMHKAWHRLMQASDQERRRARRPPTLDTARPSPVVSWRARLPKWAWFALLGVTIAAATLYFAPWENSTSNGLPPGYVPLDRTKVAPKPQTRAAVPACDGRKAVGHQLPDSHVGDVWMLVTSLTGAPTRSDIDIQWGPVHWTDVVLVSPGDGAGTHGGTLIVFQKREHGTPEVTMTSSEPVCVRFGTSATAPLPAYARIVDAKGWRDVD